MRRLPVYFVLDCSESMIGEPIAQMESGIRSICRDLRSDPNALETAFVSVIAFAGVAKTIVPLVELLGFSLPALPLGSGTNLGAALDVLAAELERNIQPTSATRKGDWRPIVYVFTDGKPTEDPDAAIARWKSTKWSHAGIVAVGFGPHADVSTLRKLSDSVLLYSGSSPTDFGKFIKWVTASVTLQSTRLSDSGDSIVAAIDNNILKVIKGTPNSCTIDTDLTVVGRCSTKGDPYILKYESLLDDRQVETQGPQDQYEYSSAYKITNEYFSWSANTIQKITVNTAALYGSPKCIHCNNQYGLAICSCGNVLCVAGTDELVTCPWCKRASVFGQFGNVDVGRGLG